MQASERVPVTVVIHARNEEVNLPFTLRDVMGWADQVVLVDSESTDRTQAIAREFGAEVVSRACDRGGLVAQRNWALDTIPFRNEWVFILDADETMDPELKEEVARLIVENAPTKDGYWCRFRAIFLGRWIKHASMYPSWSLRLFRHRVVRYERREANSHPIVAPGREGYLLHHLDNHDRRGFSYHCQRMDEFSTLEGRAYMKALRRGEDQALLKGRWFGTRAERRRAMKNLFIQLPFRPVVVFIYLYVVRLGFLDGRPGFDWCILKAVTEWMITIKMREWRAEPGIAAPSSGA